MHHHNNLHIMPKESKPPGTSSMHWSSAPYPQLQAVQQNPSSSSSSSTRSAAIWSATDDEILLQARASGLNWQPIASRHFPSKSANACRKRHERLVERRHAEEDWGSQKLELVAQEYMACRREMWEILAARLGERWNVVEAKCMEKGLKTLQSTSRTAHRRASICYNRSFEETGSGNFDQHSDSGIGLGSDAEIEIGDDAASSETTVTTNAANLAAEYLRPKLGHHHHHPPNMDHVRSQSLPLAIPMYNPPPPVIQHRRTIDVPPRSLHPQYTTTDYRSTPQQCTARVPQRGISIQSVLAPTEV